MNVLNRNIFIKFLNIFIIFLSFLFIYSYLRSDICTDHDHWYIFELYRDKVMPQNARITAVFANYIYYIFIPKIFNIHINDVANKIVPFCTAFFMCLAAIVCLNIYYLFHKTEKSILCRKSFIVLYPVMFVLLGIYPISKYNSDVVYFSSLHSTYRYFDYYFGYIFFIIVLCGIIHMLFNKKCSYIICFISAIILCLSNESLCLISVIINFLILLYCIIFRTKHDISNKSVKYLFCLFIILLITSAVQYFLSGYATGENVHYSNAALYKTLDMINFYDFFSNFYRVVIKENCISILALIILFFLILKNKDNKSLNNKVLCISICIYLGYIILFLSEIVLFSPSTIGYEFQYLLDYPPLKAYYFRTLIILIAFLSGYLYNKIQPKQQKILVTAFVSILYLIFFSNVNEFINEYNIQQKIIDVRKSLYISDKICLLYNEYDGIALLPISYYDKYSQYLSLFRPISYDPIFEISSKIIEMTKKEVQQGQSRLFLYMNEKEADNEYMNYINNAYNVKLKGITFVNDEIALEQFKKIGGEFSSEELKKLNFTYLKRKAVKQPDINNIQKNLENNNELSDFYAAKCRYYIDNNNYSEAVKNCDIAIRLNKKENYNHQEYLYLRAIAKIKNSDNKGAIKDLEKFVKISPFSLEAEKILIGLYLMNNDIKYAETEINKILNLFPYAEVRGFVHFETPWDYIEYNYPPENINNKIKDYFSKQNTI